MTFDEAYKAYKRFLKDMGVFRRVMEIHSKGKLNEYDVKKKLFLAKPSMWIQSSQTFCYWPDEPEGCRLWWSISILWQIKCLQHEIILNGFDENKDALNENILFNVRNYIDAPGISDITKKYHDMIIDYIKEKNL